MDKIIILCTKILCVGDTSTGITTPRRVDNLAILPMMSNSTGPSSWL